MNNLAKFPEQAQAESRRERPIQWQRAHAARLISQILFGVWRDEQGINPPGRLVDAGPDVQKAFIEAGEVIVNATLDPDRLETAVFCMADIFYADGDLEYRTLASLKTLDTRDRRTATHYHGLGLSALHAFKANLSDTPPDVHYRDEMCRVVDAIAPKGGA